MITNVLLILFGFLLGRLPEWWRRRRRLAVHWAALQAEINICKRRAEWYINGTVMAPLYRFPTQAFKTSLPVLLVDGDMSAEEFEALTEFYSWTQDINRGLENADEMRKASNQQELEVEYRRNLAKAEELISSEDGGENLYSRAMGAINRHRGQTTRWAVR